VSNLHAWIGFSGPAPEGYHVSNVTGLTVNVKSQSTLGWGGYWVVQLPTGTKLAHNIPPSATDESSSGQRFGRSLLKHDSSELSQVHIHQGRIADKSYSPFSTETTAQFPSPSPGTQYTQYTHPKSRKITNGQSCSVTCTAHTPWYTYTAHKLDHD